MATFVLVHGAWHGGWCWAETQDALHAMGHRCYAPTLTGLGERSHLLHAGITTDDHVRDIVNMIRWQELRDVILVGHSYGGMVITGVAAQTPEPLGALVYLDAFVPETSGLSLFDLGDPERLAGFQAQIDAGAAGVEPDYFDAWAESEATKDWLRRQCTPQPAGTFSTGATLTGREAEVAHKHFILCARNQPSYFWAEYEKINGRAGWSHEQIDTLHDAMIEAPEVLAGKLNRYANTLS